MLLWRRELTSLWRDTRRQNSIWRTSMYRNLTRLWRPTLKSNAGDQTVCKKKNLSWLFGADRIIRTSGLLFGITRQSLVMPKSDPRTEFSIHTSHPWKILIVFLTIFSVALRMGNISCLLLFLVILSVASSFKLYRFHKQTVSWTNLNYYFILFHIQLMYSFKQPHWLVQ